MSAAAGRKIFSLTRPGVGATEASTSTKGGFSSGRGKKSDVKGKKEAGFATGISKPRRGGLKAVAMSGNNEASLTLFVFPDGGGKGGRFGSEASFVDGHKAATVVKAEAGTGVGKRATTDERGGGRVFFFFSSAYA